MKVESKTRKEPRTPGEKAFCRNIAMAWRRWKIRKAKELKQGGHIVNESINDY